MNLKTFNYDKKGQTSVEMIFLIGRMISIVFIGAYFYKNYFFRIW